MRVHISRKTAASASAPTSPIHSGLPRLTKHCITLLKTIQQERHKSAICTMENHATVGNALASQYMGQASKPWIKIWKLAGSPVS